MADSPEMFASLEDPSVCGHLLMKLKRAQAASRAAIDEEFSRIGITLPQFFALSAIDESAEISSAEIARRSFVSPQAMITVVARLEAAKLITRAPASGGGRALSMRLTQKGAALLAEARAHAYAIERYVLEILGSAEYEHFEGLIDRFADALSAEHTVTATRPWEKYVDGAAARLEAVDPLQSRG